MKRIIVIFCFLALGACGYDSFDDMTIGDVVAESRLPNADISLLYENYHDKPISIKEDMVFGGYVTSSDEEGNFFRSFVIDDGTGALEILAGFYDIYNYYQPGRRVVVHAKRLAAGRYNGIMQLGYRINSYSSYRVEEFGQPMLLADYVRRDTLFSDVKPIVKMVSELSDSDCGRLVTFARLKADSSLPVCWGTGTGGTSSSGVVRFRDADGNCIAVVTSGYSDFADEEVPADSVSLTGILMYGKFGNVSADFALKLRGLYDVR